MKFTLQQLQAIESRLLDKGLLTTNRAPTPSELTTVIADILGKSTKEITDIYIVETVQWFKENRPDTAALLAKNVRLFQDSGEGSRNPAVDVSDDNLVNLDRYRQRAILRVAYDTILPILGMAYAGDRSAWTFLTERAESDHRMLEKLYEVANPLHILGLKDFMLAPYETPDPIVPPPALARTASRVLKAVDPKDYIEKRNANALLALAKRGNLQAQQALRQPQVLGWRRLTYAELRFLVRCGNVDASQHLRNKAVRGNRKAFAELSGEAVDSLVALEAVYSLRDIFPIKVVECIVLVCQFGEEQIPDRAMEMALALARKDSRIIEEVENKCKQMERQLGENENLVASGKDVMGRADSEVRFFRRQLAPMQILLQKLLKQRKADSKITDGDGHASSMFVIPFLAASLFGKAKNNQLYQNALSRLASHGYQMDHDGGAGFPRPQSDAIGGARTAPLQDTLTVSLDEPIEAKSGDAVKVQEWAAESTEAVEVPEGYEETPDHLALGVPDGYSTGAVSSFSSLPLSPVNAAIGPSLLVRAIR